MSSVIYTVGTALRYAADQALWVELMVQGHWITGEVLGIDGQGVVLRNDTLQQALVQLAHVSVVRMHINERALQIPQQQYA